MAAFAGNWFCVRSDGRVYCQPSTGAPVVTAARRTSFVSPAWKDAIDLSGNRSLMRRDPARHRHVRRAPTPMIFRRARRGRGDRDHRLSSRRGTRDAWRRGSRNAPPGRQVGKIAGVATITARRGRYLYMPQARLLATATLVPGVQGGGLSRSRERVDVRADAERQVVCWGMQQDQGPRMKVAGRTSARRSSPTSTTSAPPGAGPKRLLRDPSRPRPSAGAGPGHPAPTTSAVASCRRRPQGHPAGGALGQSRMCGTATVASCFGYPYTGALSVDLSRPTRPNSTTVTTLVEPSAREVCRRGRTLSCALTSNNDVYCWGRWYRRRHTRRAEPHFESSFADTLAAMQTWA